MECGIWREPSKANELWVREAMPDYDYLWAKRLGWVSGKTELYPEGHGWDISDGSFVGSYSCLHQ
jgi:hypothetical protein